MISPRPASLMIFLLIAALGVALAALFAWSLENRRPTPRYDPAGAAQTDQGGQRQEPR